MGRLRWLAQLVWQGFGVYLHGCRAAFRQHAATCLGLAVGLHAIGWRRCPVIPLWKAVAWIATAFAINGLLFFAEGMWRASIELRNQAEFRRIVEQAVKDARESRARAN